MPKDDQFTEEETKVDTENTINLTTLLYATPLFFSLRMPIVNGALVFFYVLHGKRHGLWAMPYIGPTEPALAILQWRSAAEAAFNNWWMSQPDDTQWIKSMTIAQWYMDQIEQDGHYGTCLSAEEALRQPVTIGQENVNARVRALVKHALNQQAKAHLS